MEAPQAKRVAFYSLSVHWELLAAILWTMLRLWVVLLDQNVLLEHNVLRLFDSVTLTSSLTQTYLMISTPQLP